MSRFLFSINFVIEVTVHLQMQYILCRNILCLPWDRIGIPYLWILWLWKLWRLILWLLKIWRFFWNSPNFNHRINFPFLNPLNSSKFSVNFQIKPVKSLTWNMNLLSLITICKHKLSEEWNYSSIYHLLSSDDLR